jgi:hypothetical protein
MVDIFVNNEPYRYRSNPVHRNGRTGKSQWIITVAEEHGTFSLSIQRHWQEASAAWGFHMPNGEPAYLGVDRDHGTRLFIARFEARTTPQVWHGYPVNHRDDCPPTSVLNHWLQERVLPRAKLSKIICSKKCNL